MILVSHEHFLHIYKHTLHMQTDFTFDHEHESHG